MIQQARALQRGGGGGGCFFKLQMFGVNAIHLSIYFWRNKYFYSASVH